MSKALWEILVPVETISKVGQSTLHTDIPLSVHQAWDARVRAVVGGLTILKPGKGEWVSPDGHTFAEKMIPVRVCCTEHQIEWIAEMTAQHYAQDAVMFYKLSDEVFVRDFSNRVWGKT